MEELGCCALLLQSVEELVASREGRYRHLRGNQASARKLAASAAQMESVSRKRVLARTVLSLRLARKMQLQISRQLLQEVRHLH